jgi:ABC-type transporter Mla subunit MlaD
MSSSSLAFRALAALSPALQQMARRHVAAHPADDLSELVSELAIAALELADRSTDTERVFARARSRLRRASQDPSHYSAQLDDERHDTIADDEPTPTRRADITREIAQRQHVTLRRAQQLVRAQIERAMQGDLFVGAGGAA